MKKARQFLRHRFSEHARTVLHRDYQLHKELWRVTHPNATPAQYEAAMQEIARKLGL